MYILSIRKTKPTNKFQDELKNTILSKNTFDKSNAVIGQLDAAKIS